MSGEERIDLERLARGSRFSRRVVELAGGEELLVDAGAWRGTIVFLETGEVELECVAGGRRRFGAGAVLCVLPTVRVVRHVGRAPARLIAIARQAAG